MAPCGTVAAVNRFRAAAWMASLLPGLGGCLLYTNEINGEPSVSIEAPGTEFFRGVPIPVTARVRDDSDPAERVTVEWVETEGSCPREAAAAPGTPARGGSGSQYQLTLRGLVPICLFARAVDSSGAQGAWRHREFTARNRPARAAFEISPAPTGGSLPLYSRVVLTPKKPDEDDDPVKYLWRITTPVGPLEDAKAACPAGAPDGSRCFVTHKEGRYELQLVVEELLPAGMAPAPSAPERMLLDVDRDRPPCLELTDPALYQNVVLIPSGTKRSFSVSSVRDDGEPYPGPGENGRASFVWSIFRPGPTPGAPVEMDRFSTMAPTFEVAEFLFGNPRPGDQFQVRVEVWDKASKSTLGTTSDLPCPIGQAVCRDMNGKDGSACVRWTTWTVQFHP
jgi:hypothetical protein